MTGTRPERPLLATLVCIWEVFIVVLAIVTHYTVNHLHNSRPPGQSFPPIHPVGPLQTAASWLTYTLAVAAAVTLWRMHRSAFVLSASIAWYAYDITSPEALALPDPDAHPYA